MQKAPVMKGSGLKPVDEIKSDEVIHVFGKNLEERVVAHEEQSTSASNDLETEEPSFSEDSDMSSIKKRKFDAITGEEDEETVFQGEFKLFVWDLSTSNWIEKGRGQLRLNDSIDEGKKRSRLIMRISGTLRIILNVAMKKSFFRVIANSKTNIRFTDSQTVWAASGTNANQLKSLIDERLEVADTDDHDERESDLVDKKLKSSEDGDDSQNKVKKPKAESVEEPTQSNEEETHGETQDQKGVEEESKNGENIEGEDGESREKLEVESSPPKDVKISSPTTPADKKVNLSLRSTGSQTSENVSPSNEEFTNGQHTDKGSKNASDDDDDHKESPDKHSTTNTSTKIQEKSIEDERLDDNDKLASENNET